MKGTHKNPGKGERVTCYCGSPEFFLPTTYEIIDGSLFETTAAPDASRFLRCNRCLRRVELRADGKIGQMVMVTAG